MKCIINQGISGSGKSSSVKAHLASGHVGHTEVCSADAYFIVDGEYCFAGGLLVAAHAACFEKFELVTRKHRLAGEARFIQPVDFVFVDNTNCTRWEMFPYIQLANLRGYEVEVHTYLCDAEIAAGRNVHDVPREVIDAMAKRLEAPLPYWPCTHITHGAK